MFCQETIFCSVFVARWNHLWEAMCTPGIFLPWGVILSLFPALLIYFPYRALLDGRREFAENYVNEPGMAHPRAPGGSGPRAVSGAAFRVVLKNEADTSGEKWRIAAGVILVCCLTAFVALQVGEFQRAEGSQTHAGHLALFSQDWVRGAAIGFLGAYFNLLVTLGRRLATRDPSVAVLVAQSRTLITGAFLAAFVSEFPGLELGSESQNLACFLVGAAPSMADGYITNLARRVFGDTRAPSALRPLEHIAGMSLGDADRLAEDGITDAQHLCNANPMALYLRVPFSLRQVLDWTDEALLYRYLTVEAFQSRTRAGLTGAIDFARAWAEARSGHPDAKERWGKVVEILGLDPLVACRIGDLLLEDTQLSLVWRLYNALHADADGQGLGVPHGQGPASVASVAPVGAAAP